MDALRALLRELGGCFGDVEARWCCVRIHNALANDPLLRVEATRDGAVVEAMLAAVVAHPADAELQHFGWAVIAGLLGCAPENETGAAAAACRLGALPAGVRALRMHLSNNEVQRFVCFMLGTLSERGESVTSQLGELGAVEAAAASLREHSMPETASQSTRLLFKLVTRQPQNCARALQAGVFEAVAAAMHDAHGLLALLGFGILAELCSVDDSTFSARATASNIVEVAISGLRRLAAEDIIDGRTAACLLLANLCVREEMAREVVALGGVLAVLAAMRVRPVNDLMLKFGVETCFNCCFHAPDLRSALVSAGVVEGAVSAMEAGKLLDRAVFWLPGAGYADCCGCFGNSACAQSWRAAPATPGRRRQKPGNAAMRSSSG
jgi:hypothetical protein